MSFIFKIKEIEIIKKVLFVLGTRPEAIKMAPVILYMKKEAKIDVKVCVTAQHRQMLDQVLQLFQIEPDYDLDLMTPGQGLSDLSARILYSFDRVLVIEKPSLVFVHGDTTTSIVAALSCYYRQIPVGHIEAGLRSGDLHAPWPEEGNRRLTAQLTTLHFAPTELNAENLISEGIAAEKIFVVGNTVIDALFQVRARIIAPDYTPNIRLQNEILVIDKFERMVLITGHRRENFGANFTEICLAIRDLARKYTHTLFLYPVHLNPRVLGQVNSLLSGIGNIRLTKPFDYEEFVFLMDVSYLVLTDSGGIQEEAPALGKPVLIMRKNTERPEGIIAGTSILVGYEREKIVSVVSRLIDDPDYYRDLSQKTNPYGIGDSSVKISEIVKRELK